MAHRASSSSSRELHYGAVSLFGSAPCRLKPYTESAETHGCSRPLVTHPSLTVPAHTLDDVVALLLQIEPGDSESLRELRELLRVLVDDPSLAPAARPPLAAALDRMARMGRAKKGDAALLDDLRQLIGDAVDARDSGAAIEHAIDQAFEPAAVAPDDDALGSEDDRLAEAFAAEASLDAPDADALGASLALDLASAGPVVPRATAEAIADALIAANDKLPVPPASAADDVPVEVVLPEDPDLSLLGEFVGESIEYLEASEGALLQLEGDPDDKEAVNTIFRAFHTIKGTSAFLGLDLITEFAHHAETLLARVRDKEIRCTGGYAGLALRSVDILKALIRAVDTALKGDTPRPVEGYRLILSRLEQPEAFDISEVEKRKAWSVGREVADDPTKVAMAASRASTEKRADSTVRVRTDRLDRLVDMVGELVIAQTMISQDQLVKAAGHHDLRRKVGHAEKIVRELQDLSMGMRMVPLKSQFQKVARLVRDLAHRNGKLVYFAGEGEETEIDRNMVDYLGDPLVHMVRNAVDHGIESPDEREAAGKPRIGVLRIAAYHAGGNVIVELKDDGRGLNREKIIRKAISQGLIASADGMADSDVYNLIFAPGFSTADRITDVSGRGVGMDVVRRNIESLRGRIDIQSDPGKGTTFTIRLPLTLAITDGMLVRVGTERYIVPTIAIQLSFRPERSMLSTLAARGEMVMLRGEVLPLVRLHRVFDVDGAAEDPVTGLLMIVGDGGERGALLVDELLGQHQVVAKSLGDGVGRVRGLSGGAILGDGRVGLILDVPELLAISRLSRETDARVAEARQPAVA
jgi:two-component system, chemotaxis family, sensor kinase CheA